MILSSLSGLVGETFSKTTKPKSKRGFFRRGTWQDYLPFSFSFSGIKPPSFNTSEDLPIKFRKYEIHFHDLDLSFASKLMEILKASFATDKKPAGNLPGNTSRWLFYLRPLLTKFKIFFLSLLHANASFDDVSKHRMI